MGTHLLLVLFVSLRFVVLAQSLFTLLVSFTTCEIGSSTMASCAIPVQTGPTAAAVREIRVACERICLLQPGTICDSNVSSNCA